MFQTKLAEMPGSIALLLLRLGSGLMMLRHGWEKLVQLSDIKANFPDPFGWGHDTSLYLTLFAELICPVLVILGFITRLSVLPLLIAMGVAIFSIHAADPFANKELAVFYFLVYLALLLAGPGKFSLDKWVLKK
ncbi:MAG: DoxX family protein [Chitinophagaceae bacterium]|nr:DoxX family protein [Chitinophagaceae bacterium]